MKTEIKYTTKFRKQYREAGHKIKAAFAQTLELFFEDRDHPTLRNHSLKEKFASFKSINVTADWRAIYKEAKTGKQVIVTFHLLVGTHKELYG